MAVLTVPKGAGGLKVCRSLAGWVQVSVIVCFYGLWPKRSSFDAFSTSGDSGLAGMVSRKH